MIMRLFYKKIGWALPVFIAATTHAAHASYMVGVGMSDITGPIAGVSMAGNDHPNHAAGLSQRLHARAFITQDEDGKSVLFVEADLALLTQSIHQKVIALLKEQYGDQYNDQNVILTASHTHTGPNGYGHYALYNIPALGFKKDNFDIIISGIMQAIDKAHTSMAAGTITINQGELTNASVNRARAAFRRNPAAERAQFPLEIDPLMTVLTFKQSARPVGAISFFAVHNSSLNETVIVSGDNKGYASYKSEHDVYGARYRDRSKTPFVFAFAQTNSGDMTPHLNHKIGSGPTDDPKENARIIGERQADKALALSNSATEELNGSLNARMRYVDMSKLEVQGQYTVDGQTHTTCPAAEGLTAPEDASAALGAKPGEGNRFLTAVGGIIFPVSADIKKCHGVKKIVLPIGLMKPYPWLPEIVPVQLIKLGSLYMVGLPTELTIMAGYRIRQQVAQTLGVDIKRVLTVGYSNAYTHYTTTYEEYQQQSYEGTSTIFGPHLQAAYQQESDKLAQEIKTNAPAVVQTVTPRDLSNAQKNLSLGVIVDSPALGTKFGQQLNELKSDYATGETVKVVFQGAHPRNNPRQNDTFLIVQRKEGDNWIDVADDNDWETLLQWRRTLLAGSRVTISWKIPDNTLIGTYRIVYQGDSKSIRGKIKGFVGVSQPFGVSSSTLF